MRKNQKEKIISHMAQAGCLFLRKKKKKRSQGMQGNFYTINLGGCFACGGVWLEITSREGVSQEHCSPQPLWDHPSFAVPHTGDVGLVLPCSAQLRGRDQVWGSQGIFPTLPVPALPPHLPDIWPSLSSVICSTSSLVCVPNPHWSPLWVCLCLFPIFTLSRLPAKPN